MDRDLHVYTDLSGESILIGRLWLREKNGRETATFRYERTWLRNARAYALSPSLALGEGAFHSDDGIFGAFGDAAPDRWGKKLMRQRDRARDAGTKPRALLSGDFLIGVNDETRLGALRFKEVDGEHFLSQSTNPVPLLFDLRKLLGATNRLERGRERKGDLELVLAPGGSLGGARPKATVRGDDKRLHVAKFPWAKDEWSVIRWEATALTLAQSAGISVPDWRLIPLQANAVLLLARFDRKSSNRRVPFMSAMTALDGKDHEEHSYLEIVDALRRIGGAAQADAAQLWRRMIFNVVISNTDDHPRNHALLRGEKGWHLSPAFDMNPTPADISGGMHVLALNELDHTGSLEIALSTADYFGLKLAEAKQVAGEIAAAVATWKSAAEAMGISEYEIERMSSAFLQEDIEDALSYTTVAAIAKSKQSAGRKRKSGRDRGPKIRR